MCYKEWSLISYQWRSVYCRSSEVQVLKIKQITCTWDMTFLARALLNTIIHPYFPFPRETVLRGTVMMAGGITASARGSCLCLRGCKHSSLNLSSNRKLSHKIKMKKITNVIFSPWNLFEYCRVYDTIMCGIVSCAFSQSHIIIWKVRWLKIPRYIYFHLTLLNIFSLHVRAKHLKIKILHSKNMIWIVKD